MRTARKPRQPAKKSRPAPKPSIHDRFTQRVLDIVADLERKAADGSPAGPTGFTLIKFRQPPIETLVKHKAIGQEELQAALDINHAICLITYNLRIRPQSLEQKSPTTNQAETERAKDIRIQRTYKQWCATCQPDSIAITIAAAVDQQPISQIAQQTNKTHRAVKRELIDALKLYAQLAGYSPRTTIRKEN